jgi:hypothetical protein
MINTVHIGHNKQAYSSMLLNKEMKRKEELFCPFNLMYENGRFGNTIESMKHKSAYKLKKHKVSYVLL